MAIDPDFLEDVLPPFQKLLQTLDNVTIHPYYTGPFEVFEERSSSSVTWDLDATLSVAHKYGGPILEIGCGSGRVAFHLAQKGFKVHGIDASKNSIARFSMRLQRQPDLTQRLHAVQGNFLDDNQSIDGKFNIALLANISINLFWQPDAATSLLERVRRVLAPDGVFCFAMFSDTSAQKMAVYQGSSYITVYRDDDEVQRLMWRALKFDSESQLLYQTYFLEDTYQGKKDVSAHISVLKERMWSPSTFMPLLQAAGFVVVEKIECAIRGGGADGWETVMVVAVPSSN
jgi:tellurite methyltransferase